MLVHPHELGDVAVGDEPVGDLDDLLRDLALLLGAVLEEHELERELGDQLPERLLLLGRELFLQRLDLAGQKAAGLDGDRGHRLFQIEAHGFRRLASDSGFGSVAGSELVRQPRVGLGSGKLLDGEVADRMEVLLPQKRHQIVLVVREERDPVETAKKRPKLLKLESRAEREPTDAVAVEKKRQTVGPVGALEDHLVLASKLRFQNHELHFALFGYEGAQPLVEVELEPLGHRILRVVQPLGFLRLDQKTDQLADPSDRPAFVVLLGQLGLFRGQREGSYRLSRG